jgi:aryl-alcohol dehydrogenase-like predicted oxidoreductase|tara:strand:+ start:5788 stop:6618 length:831 start_codon:yes stop_codon:yes gene_type:complete
MKNQLLKRRLGRTNLQVTELGFGAMDTPQVPEGKDALLSAINLGVNFIDTARIYDGSEFLIGQILPSFNRDDLIIASKTINRTRDGAQHDVDRSLSLMNLNRIDLYQLDDVAMEDWDLILQENGALEGLKIAKYRGLINHIGISSHDLSLIDIAIESKLFDTVMIEYSAFYSETYNLTKKAYQNDIGVIAMRPLGGSGRMTSLRTVMERNSLLDNITPSNLLEFVLSNSNIAVSIVGTRYPDRVKSNVETALHYKHLNNSEKEKCKQAAGKLFELL